MMKFFLAALFILAASLATSLAVTQEQDYEPAKSELIGNSVENNLRKVYEGMPLYGKTVSQTAMAVQDASITEYVSDFIANSFGVSAADLRLTRADYDEPLWKENEEGIYYVFYEQVYSGLPVFSSSFGVIVNNRKVVLVDSRIYRGINISTMPAVTEEKAINAALEYLNVGGEFIENTSLAVFPAKTSYYLAWKIETKPAAGGDWTILVDAQTGSILAEFNNMISETLSGNVTGSVYPEYPSQQKVTVNFSSQNVTLFNGTETSNATNANGSYVINANSGNYTLRATLQGPFVKVIDLMRQNSTHERNLSIPSSYSWNWDESNYSYKGEALNLFYHANKIHDYFTRGSPFNVTEMNYQSKATVQYTGTDPYCNAYSNGTDIFFTPAGGGCESTALSSDVIYHEYTHSVHHHVYGNTFSIPIGAVREGLGDYFAATINNNSCMAEEIFGSACTRNLNNTMRYPENFTGQASKMHSESRIFSGALWDMRSQLSAADNLTIMAMKMRPDTFSDYLTSILVADDDNANLSDKTPNWSSICDSFYANHGIISYYCFSFNTTGSREHLFANLSDINIPGTGEWVSSYVNVTDKGRVKKLTAYAGITHTYIGDLRVNLISPSGKMTTLHNRTGGTTDNIYTWYDNDTMSGGAEKLNVFVNGEAEGIWSLNVSDNSLDDLGSIDEFRLAIFIDKPPSITVVSPSNGSVQLPTVPLNITVDEDAASCSRSIDSGDNLTLNSTGRTWYGTASLSDGSHSVKFHCTDASNSTNSTDAIFFTSADTMAPNITFVSTDVNNSFVGRNYTFINASVSDNVAVDSCILEWSGINRSMAKLGSGSSVTCFLNKSAAEGAYAYIVYVNDSSGNLAAASRTVTFDTTQPNITFVSPDGNSSFVSRNYTLINASIADALSPVDSCVLEWNGINQSMTKIGSGSSVSCFINKSSAEGVYNYTIYTNDTLGNLAAAARTITFDVTKPSLNIAFTSSIFSPNGDGLLDEVSFNVTSSETVDFDTIYITGGAGRVKRFNAVDNASSAVKTWNGSCTPQYCNGTAAEGSYGIEVNAADKAGNWNGTNFTSVILDTVPIHLQFGNGTPLNETLLARNSVFINVTTGETPNSVVLEWNGTNETMSGSGTAWSRSKHNLTNGNYTFRVHANDSAGNKNVSETRWVFINSTRNATSLLNNLNQTLSAKNITFRVINSTGHTVDSTLLLSSENYTLKFNASSILIETANFAASNLNLAAALNITSTIAAEINVSRTFNESGGTLDSYVWIDLNGMLPAGSFTAKITFPRVYALYFYLNGTKDAPNITRVTAVCDANLSSLPCYNTSLSDNTSALYLPSFSGGAGGNDTQAPSITINSPTATAYTSSSIGLNYTVSENVAVSQCWYSLNNATNITLAGCANATITATEGANTLIVYANDTANNTNYTSISFTLDTSAPSTPPSTSGGGSAIFPTPTPTATATPTPLSQVCGSRAGYRCVADACPSECTGVSVLYSCEEGLTCCRGCPYQKEVKGMTEANESPEEIKSIGENLTETATTISPPTGFVFLSPANILSSLIAAAVILLAALVWKGFRNKAAAISESGLGRRKINASRKRK